MKLRRNAVTILFLAAALLLGSAVNSVHGQGITYAGQAFVQKVQRVVSPASPACAPAPFMNARLSIISQPF